MKKKNIILSEKVNTIQLSDAFRRHAEFDNHRLAQGMVACSRALLCQLSYFRPEYPRIPENKNTANALKNILHTMIGMASVAGIKEIVLPVGGEGPFADFLRRDVLDRMDESWDVKLSLQENAYSGDCSDIGPIDENIKTVLDEGIRGLVNIRPEFR